MLDFLRKRKRNWSITILLGIIILVFIAFYGGSKINNSTSVADVAEVNGEPVSQREFAIQYEREVQRYRDILKGSLTQDMLKGLNIKGNLVEALIQKKLALQEARSLGLTVSDDDLANHLAKTPEFQLGGRFNKDRYLQVLQLNRLVPVQFEEEQRDQLTIQRLYSLVFDSVHVTDAEARERYRVEQEKIDLSFIKLPISDFLSEVKLTDAEIKSYYERNKSSLKEPLKIQIEYLSYPYDQFGGSVQVSDKEIEDYYKTNLNTQFHRPKEVKVRYISIPVEPGTDAVPKKTAQARAEAVVKAARSGKDFAQLAQKESSDATAAKGGDIGWIAAGQMPPPVQKVLFGLAKGAVSDPIETPAGYQIFKVEDIREEKTLTLEEATPEITTKLKSEKAKREAVKAADRDREKALAGADFSKLAKESAATLKTTSWITSGQIVPDIGENQEFYKTAFSLNGKDVGSLVEGKNSYYLLRLKQRQEPTVPPLASVASEIENNLKRSKAYELALQRGNSLLEQLKKNKDIAKLAQANNLKLDDTGWFLRSAPQLPKIGELAEMKTAPIALTEQKPIPDRLYSQKDALYIVAFKGSQGADMAQFEKEKELIKKQALSESRQRALVKFMEGLKSKAEIKVNTGFLEES